MLTAGGLSGTLAEILQLSDPKLNAPRDGMELNGFVGGYSVLVDCLLGEAHPAAIRLRDHAAFWRFNAAALINLVRPAELAGLLMLVMQSIQLTTIQYINSALRLGVAAPSPDYGYIEEAFQRRTWQNLSQMPPRYQDTPPAVPKPTPGLPPAGGKTPEAPAAPRLSTRVDAPLAQQVGDWHTKFAASPKMVVALKEVDGRPLVCLSYHLRGTCFDSCREKATHCALTAVERKTIQGFLDSAL
jgi:hypothetical protein